jgi:phosphoribosylamine--glycine ligase
VKVLVVGGGGREHAIVRALARSPQRPELLCAPGNPGIGKDARLVETAADDVEGIAAAVEKEGVEFTVVGPEAPLAAGLIDVLAAHGRLAFGPSAAAARLESSKAFAKEMMEEAGVPTARWRRVGTLAEGEAAAKELANPGVVVKADGLAAGKGVTVADLVEEAGTALREIFVEGRFAAKEPARPRTPDGAPGGDPRGVPDGGVGAVVEERLAGPELSLLALCDGERALPMASARDYKRLLDGDAGPNTGGMGAYSPVAGFGEARTAELAREVHQPIVEAMRRRGTPFHGVLYAGLILTAEGPKVLEYNARFGDPETQAVLPRLRSDLLELLLRASRRSGLKDAKMEWAAEYAVTVTLASAGYPEAPRVGDAIRGLERVGAEIETTHAGTAPRDGGLVTAGGRVLNTTALHVDPDGARAAAYAAARMIEFDGMQMRKDIAAGIGTADG